MTPLNNCPGFGVPCSRYGNTLTRISESTAVLYGGNTFGSSGWANGDCWLLDLDKAKKLADMNVDKTKDLISVDLDKGSCYVDTESSERPLENLRPLPLTISLPLQYLTAVIPSYGRYVTAVIY